MKRCLSWIVFSAMAGAAPYAAADGAQGLANVYSRPPSVVEQAGQVFSNGPTVEASPSDLVPVDRHAAQDAEGPRSLDSFGLIQFPRDRVRTVGDAMRHLMARTGYTMKFDPTDERLKRLLASPLPLSKRTLGPDTVEALLAMLAGPEFELVINDAARTVAWAQRSDGNAATMPSPALINTWPSVTAAPAR